MGVGLKLSDGTAAARHHERCGRPRALLEDAPDPVRRALRTGWTSLGLQHGSLEDRDCVLGWRLWRSEPDVALLCADRSRLGVDGEVLIMREHGAVMIATFLQVDAPVARGLWLPVAPGHRQVVRRLLEQGIRRATGDG